MYSGDLYGLNFEFDSGGIVNQYLGDFHGFGDNVQIRPAKIAQSLLLDNEKGELVKSSERVGKKNGGSEGKTAAALKSHSEAEKRRRERINAHLETLRSLVPSNEKMDKAALLAEVISQVKHLKEIAIQASEGLPIPMDSDEVKVEKLAENTEDGSSLFQASLCCAYRPSLLSDIKQALHELPVKLTKSEISTLEGRVKTIFLFTSSNNNRVQTGELIESSVRVALNGILDKVSASAEYYEHLYSPNKRRRVTDLASSYSSS